MKNNVLIIRCFKIKIGNEKIILPIDYIKNNNIFTLRFENRQIHYNIHTKKVNRITIYC